MVTPARTGEALVVPTDSVPWARRIPAEVMLLVGLTLLGAVLRFATVSHQSFWLDEALAARELHVSFSSMLDSIGRGEPNPPLFFLIAWPWTRVTGLSDAGIRSLSVVAGTALIPIAYLCGRELVSRRAGLLAAAFTALSPFMIWYSQEAREYMLLAALCGASFLFFARFWHRRSRRDLIWWSVFSALAILTHYFAAFLVWPEALALLYRERSRASAIAVAAVAVVQAATLPHFISHASHPLGWIGAFPLSVRIKQVPVAFALGSIYQSSALSYGLIGAAILAAIVIALLVIGARTEELRGAGVAAAVGGAVLLVPLVLATFGHDYYVPRALIAAWIPLAVVIAAACTSIRTWIAGGALALLIAGTFVYMNIRINSDNTYQRPNWRGVAAALGRPSGSRAVVAYDGGFAAVPIALYLHGNALRSVAPTPVPVDELDVVGSVYTDAPRTFPAGVRLIGHDAVDGYLVERFALGSPTVLTQSQMRARATQLYGLPATGSTIVLQRSSA
jgi:mannosyltransferase